MIHEACWRWMMCSIASLMCIGLGLGMSSAQAAPAANTPEPMIKAAIVYNLRHFVDWPRLGADSLAVVQVGVVGTGPVANALLGLSTRAAAERGMRIVRVTDDATLGACDLLYLDANAGARDPDRLAALEARSVLTVSDAEDFLERGGILQLVVRDRRVRIRIQLDRARRAHLQFRAQLLTLAEIAKD